MTTRHRERVTMPARRLGRRDRDPARPLLKLGDYLTGAAPAHPLSVDYFTRVPRWSLGKNDEFGTCGPTSLANLTLLVSTWLTDTPITVTDAQILDLYRRSGNPDFDPATGNGDNGVDMTVMLAEAVRGGIGPVKPLAFASVNGHSPDEVWAAGALFGGTLWGADLTVAQGSQTTWDYIPAAEWGGHAILAAGRYTDVAGTAADRTGLVSWASEFDSTDLFITNQVQERYVVIFPWHLGERSFQRGVDLTALARDYQALTGRPFPAVPPGPKPPAPAPDGEDVILASSIRGWATAPHVGPNAKAAAAARRWLTAKFPAKGL